MKFVSIFVAVLATTLMVGCGYTWSRSDIDINAADLMPESVARQFLRKYVRQDWVDSPYALCCNFWGKASDEKYPMSYAKIQSIYVLKGGTTTIRFEGDKFVSLNEMSPTELKQFGMALRALGATNLKEISYGEKKEN